MQQIFYSGKAKKHTIKYDIGICIHTGFIVWIGGGVPGSVHDLTLAQEGIAKKFQNQIFVGDKGYVGDERFITPFKNPQNEIQKLWNSELRKVRVSVEHTYSKFKLFHCLNTPWRHNIEYHPLVFQIIANLVNFDLIFHPIKQ